jgi:hypothetical protein
MAGGGVRGRDIGIAHGIMTQDGYTIKGFHPFMDGYTQAGEMITDIIVGEVTGGTINKSLIKTFA